MSLEEDFRRKPNKNWLKAAFALKCLKEGIEPFVASQINQQHAKILVGLQHSCNRCSLDTLLPPHALKVGLTCAKGRKRCLCIGSKRTIRNACPNKICGTIYDRIVDSCVFCNPFWNNTDISKWTLDSWEIAKCYINIPGYKDKSSAQETDCLGLLTIIIHNMEFWNVISTVIDDKTDVFTKVKHARNQIMHSPTLEVTDSQLNDYVKDMITILEDPKQLKSDTYAVSAKKKLQKILQDDIYISTKDEIQLREEALKAIQEITNESVRRITDMKSEALEEMNEIKEKHNTQLAGIQQNQTDLTADIQTIKERQTNIEKRVDILEADISSLKEVKNTHQSQLDYLQKKLAVQTKLCEMYQQHLSTVPVSPILSDIEANVKDVFVDLVLCDDLLQKRKTKVDEKSSRIVRNYQDIFYNGKQLCKNIYLLADAGMGKTTWCLNFLRTWVTTVKNNTQYGADQKICSHFETVLFISLRHVGTETNVLDMIRNHLFAEDAREFHMFTDVLKKEPEKCLIILDGLDEWNTPEKRTCPITQNQHIPSKTNLCGCTLLISSRKWKIFNIKLRDCEFDKAIEIRGIKDQRLLAEKVIKSLNEINDWTPPKKYEDFEEALDSVRRKTTAPSFQLSSFMNVPLILISMLCIWCEKGKVEISFSANYLALVEVLIKHADIRALAKECPMQKDNEDKPLLYGLGSKYDICRYRTVILKMSKIAFDTSVKHTSLVIDEQLFQQLMTKEELQTCLTLGFISQSKSVGKVLSRVSKFSFLHKSLQEFFAAVHIVSESQNNNKTPMKHIKDFCQNFETLSENENILLFVCGLDPRLGSELSVNISQLEDKTTEPDKKVYIMYTLPLKCIVQVHESDQGYPSQDFPIRTSNTCVTIDQQNRPIANYLILLLQCGNYTNGRAELIINFTERICITRMRPLTISNDIKNRQLPTKRLSLSTFLPACLTECSLIYIDLTKYTVNELSMFGKSFQRLTVLEYLCLNKCYTSQSFIVNLLMCSNLKKVIASENGRIALLLRKAVLFREDSYESLDTYDKQSFVLTRQGMSLPICSVKEETENSFTKTDKDAFYKMYFFEKGQLSEPINDVRNLSLTFSKIPFLEFCPFMNDIIRQYDIKTNCVTFDIRFEENVKFELSPLLRLLKKMKSLRNYSLINGNKQFVEVTNTEFGETHLTCKALTCEEQIAINSFLLLNQRRLYAKTKTIDIAFDALHETTESALKSDNLTTLNVDICSDEFSECRWLEILNAIKQMRNLVCLNIHQNSNKIVDVRCEFKKSILGTVKNDSSSKVEIKGLSEKEEKTFLSILESHKIFKYETIKVFKIKSKKLKPSLINLIKKIPFLVVLGIEASDSILSENIITGIINALKYKKCIRDLCVSDISDKSISLQHLCSECDGFIQCEDCLTNETPVKIKLLKHTPAVQNAFICLLFLHKIFEEKSIVEVEFACDTFQPSFSKIIRLLNCPRALNENDISDAKWEKLLQVIGYLKNLKKIVFVDSNKTFFKNKKYEEPLLQSISELGGIYLEHKFLSNERCLHSQAQETENLEFATKQTGYLNIKRSILFMHTPKQLRGAETLTSMYIHILDGTITVDKLNQTFQTIVQMKYLKCITIVDNKSNEATISLGIPISTLKDRIDIKCKGVLSEAEDIFFTLIQSFPNLKSLEINEVNIYCSTFHETMLDYIGCISSLNELAICFIDGILTDNMFFKLFKSLEKKIALRYLHVTESALKTFEVKIDDENRLCTYDFKDRFYQGKSKDVPHVFYSFLKSHPVWQKCVLQRNK